MKKFICLLLCIVLLAISLTACGEKIPYEKTDEVTNLVLIDVKKFGKIVVELYPEVAPITVENFKGLVADSFYDGLIFHRIIEEFMIQGGGFDEEYREKDCPSIKGEFAANGINNDLPHTRGVISMARTNVFDSASSQFFIMHEDTYGRDLDGLYAAFGKVVYGIEVVDKIATTPTNPYNNRPLEKVVITKVCFVKPVEDASK